jgi:hypothetical protein
MFSVARVSLVERAYAQPSSLNPGTFECNSIFSNGGFGAPAGTGFTCFAQYIGNLTFVVIAFAASISLIMLIINGFRYMIGPAVPGGSSDAAKKGIASALTGISLALLTYIILDTIIGAVTN